MLAGGIDDDTLCAHFHKNTLAPCLLAAMNGGAGNRTREHPNETRQTSNRIDDDELKQLGNNAMAQCAIFRLSVLSFICAYFMRR
jgi:hypothetical protein